MRILQFINALTWGGAQTLLVDLCRSLTAAGHSVSVAAFRDGPVGETLREEGFPVQILGEGLLDLRAFRRLRRRIATWRPHLVHSHLCRATLWARLARREGGDFRLITSFHGFESEVFHQLERRMASLSDHLIFPSRFLAWWYGEHLRPLPAHRFTVIPPGAALADAPRHEGSSRPLRLGTLSRLHPLKGIDVLLRAAERLRGLNREFRLVIGGEGREEEHLRNISREAGLEGITTFAGPVSRPGAFLAGLDIFVAPSRQEAFGITVCEAMERELAVVASAVGGIPETIRDGTDGMLVPPEDVGALTEALRSLIDDPVRRRQLGRSGRERVAACFSRTAALAGHLACYQRQFDGTFRRAHFAISSPEMGGGERLALSLAQALRDRHWRVTATCGGDPLAAALREAGIPPSPASLAAGGLFFATRLARDMRVNRTQLLSAHLNRAALAAGLLGSWRDWFTVSHVHGLNRVSYYRASHRIIAVSHAVKRHLLSQDLADERITVLPNRIPGRAVAVARPPGPPWIVAIPAKLHANKGHRWALEALAEGLTAGLAADRMTEKAEGLLKSQTESSTTDGVTCDASGFGEDPSADRRTGLATGRPASPAVLPPFQLWILGDGPERQDLETRFTKGPLADRITFWGFQPDLDRFYPDIHLVLLPSLGEGIPLSLLEAMRWGIPCVATRTGGVPEIVTEGRNGLLIPPGDGARLRQAIREALQPERWTQLSAGASAAFVELNRFDDLVDRFEAILREGLDTPG